MKDATLRELVALTKQLDNANADARSYGATVDLRAEELQEYVRLLERVAERAFRIGGVVRRMASEQAAEVSAEALEAERNGITPPRGALANARELYGFAR